MFGQYKDLQIREGVLTGKGVGWGGSLAKLVTGYGIVYFTENAAGSRRNNKG